MIEDAFGGIGPILLPMAIACSVVKRSILEYVEYAKNSKDAKILIGGNCDKSKGYFIEPTVISMIFL
ncbi:hypothetical protein N9K77_00340 [bacterium]|nr:hypothetical protein [bacterium]